ncbi:MAG: hypothetical protein V4581_17690 [Bacteroidota bacterium]
MKLLYSFLTLIMLTACAPQKKAYTPQPPQFEIMGKKILREGYVIPRSGTQAFTLNREYAGFCFDCKSLLYVISETDSLLMVAHDINRDTLFYVRKNAVGTELDIPLDNSEVNEPFGHRNYRDYDPNDSDGQASRACGEAAVKSGEFTYTDTFNPDDYPDVEVNLITEKEFSKMQKTSIQHFEENEAVKKVDSTITIGKMQFRDGRGEGNMPNTYFYEGEYKALNAYLLLYVCEACEEYSHFLINKDTGEEIASFSNRPYFSANFEYVMDMGQLFSDSPTIVRAYKWNEADGNGWYKEFANWSPVGEGFWGSDNCFYTPVIPSITAETHNSDSQARDMAKYNYRYIKIKIKAPTPYSEERGYILTPED